MKYWLSLVSFSIVLLGCSSGADLSTPTPVTESLVAVDATTTTQAPTTSAPQTVSPPTTTPISTPSSTTSTTTTPAATSVRTGAQRLADEDFAEFAGQRLGLIAHQNSIVDSGHLSNAIDESTNVELVALFGPEHGVRGDADAGVHVDNAIDPETGATVFSLFGPTRKPTPAMLADVDVLLYDLQDVGTRYYTYISTMGLAMQAAAEAGIPFVVLDRPNPLGGLVGGGLLDQINASFVGQYAIPDVYGLTSGELANFITSNDALPGIDGLELRIIELDGWDHSMVWDDIQLDWIPPSPAITTPDAALLYPATIYFEATSLSYGRGTEIPFQIVGAPWLDAVAVATELNGRGLDGVTFTATQMTPELLPGITVEPAYLGDTLPAVQLEVTDPTAIRPTEVGVHLLEVVFAAATEVGVNPLSRPDWLDQLSGSSRLRTALTSATDAEDIIVGHQNERSEITSRLEAARLYD